MFANALVACCCWCSCGLDPKLLVLERRGEGGVNGALGLRSAGEGDRERRVGDGE